VASVGSTPAPSARFARIRFSASKRQPRVALGLTFHGLWEPQQKCSSVVQSASGITPLFEKYSGGYPGTSREGRQLEELQRHATRIGKLTNRFRFGAGGFGSPRCTNIANSFHRGSKCNPTTQKASIH
jgi:hypothetical protein